MFSSLIPRQHHSNSLASFSTKRVGRLNLELADESSGEFHFASLAAAT
jgi:hypothetical protein